MSVYQSACETPNSIFGVVGNGALAFAEALAQAGIEFSVERAACLCLSGYAQAGEA